MSGLLLTGATGYVGSRVAATLDAAGVAWHPLEGRLEAIEPAGLDADVVIHCAGALRSRPDQLERANREGTARLVAGLRRPARLVFLSSRSVYPRDGHRLVDERTPPAPFDAYGRTKLAAERVLRSSPHRVTVLRLSGVFGHPERDGVFLDRAVTLALAGRPVPLAEPDRPEDAVAVDWLADAVVRAATTGVAEGMTLNLAGPRRPLGGIVAALGRAVAAATGLAVDVVSTAVPVPTTPLLDARRAAVVMGLGPHPEDERVFAAMVRRRTAGRPGPATGPQPPR